LDDAALPHLTAKVMGSTFGYDLACHCAAEMNRLAAFLPDLHHEFNGTP